MHTCTCTRLWPQHQQVKRNATHRPYRCLQRLKRVCCLEQSEMAELARAHQEVQGLYYCSLG